MAFLFEQAIFGWSPERWASIFSLIAIAVTCFQKRWAVPKSAVIYTERSGKNIPLRNKVQDHDTLIRTMEARLDLHEQSLVKHRSQLADRRKHARRRSTAKEATS